MAVAGLWEIWCPPEDEQIRNFDRDYNAKRTLRRASLTACRSAKARGVAAMARRGTGGHQAFKVAADPLPVGRHDLLAGQPPRRQCEKQ
jgi:hypothetical protein